MALSAKKVQSGVTERRARFIAAYISNGHNATQAAITAGYSEKTAGSQGQRLLKFVESTGELAATAKQAGDKAGLSVERVLNEVRRLSFSDARRLLRPDGTMMAPEEWDDDTAASVASIEVNSIKLADGELGRTTKIKIWDKNAALEKAMKHLGLYETDNKQRAPNLAIQVVYK